MGNCKQYDRIDYTARQLRVASRLRHVLSISDQWFDGYILKTTQRTLTRTLIELDVAVTDFGVCVKRMFRGW